MQIKQINQPGKLMQTFRLTISIKQLLIAGSTVLALGSVPLIAQDFDNVEITTVEVTDGIYMLQGSGGNIGVSIGSDGTFIIDDQFAPLTDKIMAAIAELTSQPVDFVVNTHFHYDHTDGNENFGRAGAYIVAQDNSRRRMEADQVLASGRLQEAYDDIALPKITFFDAMRFYFNGETIDIVNTGAGHTDGDAQIYFRGANVIHTGDMFVRYGLPFIDRNNGGTLDGMIEATWKIATLIENDTQIIPGHGQVSSREDLLDYRTMLLTIRTRLQAARAEGLDFSEFIETEPADGFAPDNANTENWMRMAWDEYE